MSTPTPPPEPTELRAIHTREEFIELSRELGVRADWHEPDEMEVDAVVYGTSFDNAGTWPRSYRRSIPEEILETHVVFTKEGRAVAAVNLATLCAWASDPEPRGTKRIVLTETVETVEETITVRSMGGFR